MTLLALALALAVGAPDAGAPDVAREPPATAKKTALKPRRIAPKPSTPEAPNDVQIKADRMEVLPGSKKALWKGHVEIDRADTKVWCDAMVADYDDNKKLTLLTCTGHTHMWQAADLPRHPEREAWGNLAVFDNLTGILTLTGSPHGREGTNELRGEKITYLSRENRTLVDAAVVTGHEQTGKEPAARPPRNGGPSK